MSCIRYAKMYSLRRTLIRGEMPLWLARHPRRDYIVQATLSCPPWVDRKELDRLKAKADEKTRLFGVKYTLDHIIPLTHPLVCGLTVPHNLKIVTLGENLRKGNRFNPYQLDLLPESEQLSILL